MLIIAEIGVNHNGDVELARRMILSAKEAGADAVKFQTFVAERLVTPQTRKVNYQERTTDAAETHYEMIRRLELSADDHRELFHYCQEIGITFISTPYDIESVDFLNSLGVQTYKIASADVVDMQLLSRIAGTGNRILLSVGMANLGEIEAALERLTSCGPRDITLLHCVSNYPCLDASLNLNVITTLREAFGVPVGYSDHSVGCEGAVLSVALGAQVIEKHFTTDKTLRGPDHAASTNPAEFKQLATSVRRAEVMLGSRRKQRQKEETQMAEVSRKSITLAVDKCCGEVISESDLRMMRPGTGLPANFIEEFVGKKARRPLSKYCQLTWFDVE